ncbi:MAG: hypothetical protein HYT13_02310 [Candidatus Liptonbacteria bacterium]|nr:hypothetical protein [Candidatus Liptonbacteria bacterium]
MSKKSVSAVVGAAGFISSFWVNLDKEVRKRGGSDKAIYEALKDDSPLVPEFAELIVEASQSKFQRYKLTVNYDFLVEEAVNAGKYDWSSGSITANNFSSTRKGEADVEVILVHFNHHIKSEEVLHELDKQGLRALELPELLAFGVNYPDVQREFPVVALGSVWQDFGERRVPCLDGLPSRRDLRLYWFDDRWRSLYRFAAVRK